MEGLDTRELVDLGGGLVRVSYFDPADGRFLGYGYIGPDAWPKPEEQDGVVVWINEPGAFRRFWTWMTS